MGFLCLKGCQIPRWTGNLFLWLNFWELSMSSLMVLGSLMVKQVPNNIALVLKEICRKAWQSLQVHQNMEFREVNPWQAAHLWKLPPFSPCLVKMEPPMPPSVSPRVSPLPPEEAPSHHNNADCTIVVVEKTASLDDRAKTSLGTWSSNNQPMMQRPHNASYDPSKSFVGSWIMVILMIFQINQLIVVFFMEKTSKRQWFWPWWQGWS